MAGASRGWSNSCVFACSAWHQNGKELPRLLGEDPGPHDRFIIQFDHVFDGSDPSAKQVETYVEAGEIIAAKLHSVVGLTEKEWHDCAVRLSVNVYHIL